MKLPMEQVKSEYKSGMSLSQLARKYGFSAPTIKTRLRESGVRTRSKTHKSNDTKRPKAKTTNLPISQIWFEYESGMKLADLAKKYGVSITTIHRRLKEGGWS